MTSLADPGQTNKQTENILHNEMSQKINHITHFGNIKNPETVLSMFRDENFFFRSTFVSLKCHQWGRLRLFCFIKAIKP